MKSLDSAPLRNSGDTSYGRLLRRLNQAMDVACTRQWMTGQPSVPGELEIQGLTDADLQLLNQILHSMNLDRATASPAVISALNGTQQ
ncbi:MAG: hypothetical protein GX071_02835 [Gammaproteobacteria bacterium]|nr:hypothetical protein [Gammaproteobacteria bacterium]